MNTKQRFAALCKFLIAGIVIVLFSCKTSSESQLVGVPISLNSICEKPGQYLNSEVDLQGTFMGWSGTNCTFVKNFAHQLMRSDWIFCDYNATCIYVTGNKPDFLDPLRKEDTGTKIKLKAILMQDKEQKFYLKYISAFKDIDNN